MKKNVLIIISIMIFTLLISGCMVDRTKALITFYNQTDEMVKMIKVGNAAFCGRLYGGQRRDIWVLFEGSGQPSAEGCESFSENYGGETYTDVLIKFDWHYRFTIKEFDGDKVIEWEALKTGYDLSTDGPYSAGDLYE